MPWSVVAPSTASLSSWLERLGAEKQRYLIHTREESERAIQVCQVLSLLLDQPLRIINCHQHTETADFIGGLRPVRGKERVLASLREGLLGFFGAAQTHFADLVDHPVVLSLASHDSMEIEKVMQVFQDVTRRLDPVAHGDLNALRANVEDLQRRYQSLFEWYDGTLVQAMRGGDLQLIDEISLADDAVFFSLF